MKHFLLVTILYTLTSAQTLTVSQHAKLHTYNHKLSQRHTIEKRMKAMATISNEEASRIAKSLCPDPMLQLSLQHQKAYLFYAVKSGTCQIKINALDGTIITKVL